jgi:hypothetical protein
MRRLRTDAIAPVSFWAVAKLAGTTQVAIKFDDLPAILMSVENAREFAAAVNAELVDEHAPAVPPLLKLA